VRPRGRWLSGIRRAVNEPYLVLHIGMPPHSAYNSTRSPWRRVMEFELVGQISAVARIAGGTRVRERRRLRRDYGLGAWLPDGTIRLAEVHWYEAHGVGRKELKIKRLLDWSWKFEVAPSWPHLCAVRGQRRLSRVARVG